MDHDRFYKASYEGFKILENIDPEISPFNYEKYGPMDGSYIKWLNDHTKDLVDGPANKFVKYVDLND